jgi:hypothetical protein
VVWENGELHVKAGHGKYIPRQGFGHAFESIAEREKERDLKKHKVERK